MTVLGKFNLLIIALLSLSIALLGYSGGYSFPSFETFLASVMPIILFGPLGLFYTYFRVNKIIAVPCMNIVAYTLFIPLIVLFGQLMAGLNFPLTDSYLAAFDTTLGFNWLSAINFFTELPSWVSIFSTKLYESTNYATIFVAVFLIFSGKHRQLDEFITYVILTAVIANIFAGFFPAASAYEYFKPGIAVSERLSAVVGQGYMNDFFALREGSTRELKLVGANGLVSFPSFHTILALLLIYVTRGTGLFSIMITVWSLGIIATTPFDGAHYITDIIGGAVVLMATIAAVQRLEPHLARILSPGTTKSKPASLPAFSA